MKVAVFATLMKSCIDYLRSFLDLSQPRSHIT